MRPSNEALLISSLINTGSATAAVALGVEPEMLYGYQPEYRWVLNYAQAYGTCPTPETLRHKFPDFPHTDAHDVGFYVDEVLYGYRKRQAVMAVQAAARLLSEDDLDEALLALSTAHTAMPARTALTNVLSDDSFFATYDQQIQSLSVPWLTLANVTGGIRPGDYWTLAARYGHGKSWMLGWIIAHALMAGQNVLFYSLEMPQAQVLTRIHVMLGALLGYETDHVAMRDRVYDVIQYRKIYDAINERVHGQLFIRDSGKVTSARIAAECPAADLTVIDYLGLMYTNTGMASIGDWRNAATISNQIKETALSTGSRILVAAQINREGDTNSKLPPRSKTLSQSDAIGQDSDVILMMKRYADSAMAVLIDKNRHGADNIHFFTNYKPNVGHFEEISAETADDRRYDEDYTA